MTDTPTFIYYTTLGSSVEQFSHYLNSAEQKKLATLHNPLRRQSFIAGRVLLSTALATHQGNPDYQIVYSQLGKPYLDSPKGWCFNLSHSGTHLYLVLQQAHSIGIDCEVMRMRKNYLRVATYLFGDAESKKIANDKVPLAAFLLRWTAHEAAIKHEGQSVFSKPNKSHATRIDSFQHQQQIVSICSDKEHSPAFHWHQWCADENIIKPFITPPTQHYS